MQNESGNCAANGGQVGRIGCRPYWLLILSILIRAVHQVGAAVFLATFLLDGFSGPPLFYVILAVLSGLLLLVSEWWRHRQLHLELSGGVTLGKVVILGVAYHGLLSPQPLVLIVFFIASVVAHAPKHVRHRLLF
jgi:uncharacterized membrane protein YhaH (DUF805 family)